MNDKKRILLIAEKGLNKSGVPSLIMSLVRSLSYKYIFDIVVFNNDDFFTKEFLSFGGNIYHIKVNSGTSKLSKLLFYFLYSRKTTKQSKNIFKNQSYYAIHSFKEDQSFPFLKLARKNGIPIRIVHTNSYQVINSFKNLIYRFFLKIFTNKTIKYSTALIGPSENVCKSFFYKPINYYVVPNPYSSNIQYCDDFPSIAVLSITHIATFSDRKNQLFDIDLISILISHGINANLNLVGKETENGYLTKIKKRIADLKLENHVIFMPPNINQKQLYKSTHISILPSKEEAFGIVAIESQAYGVHCFASNAVPPETNAGNISYLVLDPKIWADQIKDFCKKGVFRKKVDLDSFSETEFAKRIDKLYYQL